MSSQSGDDERQPFIEYDIAKKEGWEQVCERKHVWKLIALVLSFLLVVETALLLHGLRPKVNPSKDQYLTGFQTELGSFAPSIKTTEKIFSGALHVDANGEFSMVQEPNAPKYVGASREEVDRNWETLTSGRYFNLSESEIQQMNLVSRQNSAQDPQSLSSAIDGNYGIYGGSDMWHSLHCLNSLRLMIDGRMDKLGESLGERSMQFHIDHCIEQLRESIMCHGDLTPVSLKPVWIPNKQLIIMMGETEYPHTCRDWTALTEYMHSRDEYSLESMLREARRVVGSYLAFPTSGSSGTAP